MCRCMMQDGSDPIVPQSRSSITFDLLQVRLFLSASTSRWRASTAYLKWTWYAPPRFLQIVHPRYKAAVFEVVVAFLFVFFPGLHHDFVPEALLAGRPPGLPLQQQQESHLRRTSGEKDLGSWCVLCPLEALFHPWHDHGEHHAEGFSWRQYPLQR